MSERSDATLMTVAEQLRRYNARELQSTFEAILSRSSFDGLDDGPDVPDVLRDPSTVRAEDSVEFYQLWRSGSIDRDEYALKVRGLEERVIALLADRRTDPGGLDMKRQKSFNEAVWLAGVFVPALSHRGNAGYRLAIEAATAYLRVIVSPSHRRVRGAGSIGEPSLINRFIFLTPVLWSLGLFAPAAIDHGSQL